MAAIERHVSVTILAEELCLHRNTVVKLIRAGQFPNAIRVGRVWRVPQSDVNAYSARNRLSARPN
jgi:excisionase family DNA binding protein